MTSAEKILAGIIDDAVAEAAKIAEASESECAVIRAEAEKKAKAIASEIELSTEKKIETINSTGESGAALIRRDNTLSAKRERIDSVLEGIVTKVNNMPDEEYFAFYADIIKNSDMAKGSLTFAKCDEKRDFSILKNLLSGMDIEVSGANGDFENGFMLVDGDILINGTLSALIHEKYNDLVDTIYPILF